MPTERGDELMFVDANINSLCKSNGNSSFICAKKVDIFLFILSPEISEIFCGVPSKFGHPSQSDLCPFSPVEQNPPNDVHPCRCSEPPEHARPIGDDDLNVINTPGHT